MKLKQVLFFTLLCILCSQVIYADIDRTLGYISERAYDLYVEENYNLNFTSKNLQIPLHIYFANNSYTEQVHNQSVFGLFFVPSNQIIINIENIINTTTTILDNEDDEYNYRREIILRIRNTLLHEIIHYVQHKIYFEEKWSTFNIEIGSTMETMLNTQYFSDIYYDQHPNFNAEIPSHDIPFVLRETINFPAIYSGDFSPIYQPSQFAGETLARLSALCFKDNTDRITYYRYITPDNYRVCQNFVLNGRQPMYTYNYVINGVVGGYLAKYEPNYEPQHTFYQTQSITYESFNLVNLVISFVANNLIFAITTLVLVSLFITFFIQIFILFRITIQDRLKFK